SILITSAPMSASMSVHVGPAIMWVRSITFNPASGPMHCLRVCSFVARRKVGFKRPLRGKLRILNPVKLKRRWIMLRSLLLAALAVLTIVPGFARAQTASGTLEKKNYTYSEWTKGRFSEAVTVTGPGKTIYL